MVVSLAFMLMVNNKQRKGAERVEKHRVVDEVKEKEYRDKSDNARRKECRHERRNSEEGMEKAVKKNVTTKE